LGMHKAMEPQPLVSVGIPTYNRPEGLRRTLACISGQTYRNIEIIVSDNCSPANEVKQVVEEFMQHDSRISYFRQQSGIGVNGNFKFVLEKAVGDYFMWAADDDEWLEGFIEQCVKVLKQGNVVSVMSHFETSYRFEDRREEGRVPSLSIEKSKAQNALTFMGCVTPTLFYGIHRRDKINFFLQDEFFDFYDCYVVLRLILAGRVAVIEPCLYTAGVDAPTYQIKSTRRYLFTRLKYSPLLFNGIRQIYLSAMRMHEKIAVAFKLIYVVVSLFLFHEVRRVFK